MALAWAREWTFTRGNVADPQILAEFNSLYNQRERSDILAVVTCMDFANRIMNTLTGQYLDLDASTCELPPLEDPEQESVGARTTLEK